MYHVDIRTVIWRWPNFHLSEALQWRSWGHAIQKVFSRRKKIVGSVVVNQETTVHFFSLQPFFRFSFFLFYILYSDNAALMFCSGWGTWLGSVFGAYGSVGKPTRLEICLDILLKKSSDFNACECGNASSNSGLRLGSCVAKPDHKPSYAE